MKKGISVLSLFVAMASVLVAIQPINQAKGAAVHTETLVAMRDDPYGDIKQCDMESATSLQTMLDQLKQAGIAPSCSDKVAIFDANELSHSFNSGSAVSARLVEDPDPDVMDSSSTTPDKSSCSTQYINVYRIPFGQLTQAKRLGFTPVAQLRGYRGSTCD